MPLEEALWSTLSPLLDRALDLDPAGRSELVARVRAEAPATAAALERLLGTHDLLAGSSFLEERSRAEQPGLLAGRTVGPYTLVDLLGSGGMGTVWRARRSDGRYEGDVALKLVNLAMLDRDGERRFRREGTLLSRLSHPNVARLYDAGVAPSGQPYFVLELVEGLPIDEFADERGLGVRARCELFVQVADAVAHAHANLVVHRDIKPSNVLIDGEGRPKLLDFGIATLLDEATGEPAAQTLTSAHALTPAYAAPEQLQNGPATPATDVYSLGVLLYKLLSGRHPTGSDDASPAALVRDLVEREPARLSAAVAALPAADAATDRLLEARGASRKQLSRACRGDLDTILAKALKKHPAERYATAAELAEDVRRHLGAQPVSARADSAWYRTRKFTARHRFEVAAAVAAILALVVGATLAVVQARASARERDRALEGLRRAEITNDLSAFLLAEATPAGKPISKAELLSRGEALVRRSYADDPELRVQLLLTLAERYYENFQYDEWSRVTSEAFELSRASLDTRLRALAGCSAAISAAALGDAPRASGLLAGAFRDLERDPGAVAERARCWFARGIAARAGGDDATAIAAAERALALERSRRGAPVTEMEVLNSLAMGYSAEGRTADADRTFTELMALFAARGRDRTHAAANCLNNWAVFLQMAGQISRSLAVSERAVALHRELDSDRGAPPTAIWTLAGALSMVGRSDDAVAAAGEAVEKARASGSAVYHFWALAMSARVASEAGRPSLAAEPLEELAALMAARSDFTVVVHSAYDRTQAQVALANGDPGTAVTHAQSALARLDTTPRPPRDLLLVLLVLASSLNSAGDPAGAREVAVRAAKIAEDRLGDFGHSYHLGLARFELGVAQSGLGEVEAARRSLRESASELDKTVGEAAPAARRARERLSRIGG